MSVACGLSQLVCVIRSGGALFALPAASICDVLDCQAPWPVPLAPKHVAGVIVHHGDVLTVIRLASLLQQQSAGTVGALVVLQDPLTAERFALAVDAVEKVISIAETDMEPNPQTLSANFQAMFTGICRSAGELLVLLNLSSLTPDTFSEELGPPEEAPNKGAPCAH